MSRYIQHRELRKTSLQNNTQKHSGLGITNLHTKQAMNKKDINFPNHTHQVHVLIPQWDWKSNR